MLAILLVPQPPAEQQRGWLYTGTRPPAASPPPGGVILVMIISLQDTQPTGASNLSTCRNILINTYCPHLGCHHKYCTGYHNTHCISVLLYPPGSHDDVAYLHIDSGHLQPLLVQWERVLHGVNCKELCTLHFHKYSVFLFNFWFFPETKYNNIKQQIKTCLFFALIKGILNVDSSLCYGDKGFYMVVNVLSP